MKAAPALAPTAAAAPEGWSARSRPEVEVARGGLPGTTSAPRHPRRGPGRHRGRGSAAGSRWRRARAVLKRLLDEPLRLPSGWAVLDRTA